MQTWPASEPFGAGTAAAPRAATSRWLGTWWVALVVLVLNDHVLKYAGLLPGWLTGKLSDFAGLVVCPVLAAWLVRARTDRVRALAFGIVAALFSAVKLSPAAARALVTLVGWLGIRWRLWCDPTDLVALVALPLAWRVSLASGARCSAPPSSTPPPGARRRGAVPVILGAVACLATSQSLPIGFHSSAFLANMTLEPVEVRLFRPLGPLDCAQVASVPASALESPLAPERCVRLGAGRVLPLDRNGWATEAPPDAGTVPALDPPCDAVIIRTRDLPDTLLIWKQPGYVDVEDPIASTARAGIDPHGIYLERAGDQIFAAGSSLITSVPITVALPDIVCGAFPATDGGQTRDAGTDSDAGP